MPAGLSYVYTGTWNEKKGDAFCKQFTQMIRRTADALDILLRGVFIKVALPLTKGWMYYFTSVLLVPGMTTRQEEIENGKKNSGIAVEDTYFLKHWEFFSVLLEW